MQKFYFHVDDYGISPSVNNQIIDLIIKDKINSISIICNSDFYDHKIEYFKKLLKSKNIKTSCHVNLTEFKPRYIKISTLKLLIMSFFPFIFQKKTSELKKEIRKQIEIFIDNFHNPNEKAVYIDGHQHIHIFPYVLKEIKSFFEEKKINFEIRNPNENFFLFLKKKNLLRIINNYFSLLIVKFIFLFITKEDKKFISKTKFIGLIGSGVQDEEIILKALKINTKKDGSINLNDILVLFHPYKISEEDVNNCKMQNKLSNFLHLDFYSSNERDIEINFFDKIDSMNSFLNLHLKQY